MIELKSPLEEDLNKSTEQLLREVYEQSHIPEGDAAVHMLSRQLLSEKKLACFNFKVSQAMEKLTKQLLKLNQILALLTWVIAIGTLVLLFVEIFPRR
jgi:hypothetical protein